MSRSDLTPEQLTDIRESFDLFDRDGDGHITRTEFATILRSWGQTPTDEEIAQIIAQVDKNKNGMIEYDEFVEMMCNSIKHFETEEDYINAFKVFDEDNDGKITKDEFNLILKNLCEPISKDEIEMLIQIADKDKNGLIDYASFVHFMVYSSKDK
ncbi:hypothetical protein M9Y10_023017 [Tritrichomonas musculus]|uniref:EF-hand domain-containing protein n=1 Tax=Tritrichomonas musculus TaxID=1915356 RepID=A0ABR2KU81_9EUKA